MHLERAIRSGALGEGSIFQWTERPGKTVDNFRQFVIINLFPHRVTLIKKKRCSGVNGV